MTYSVKDTPSHQAKAAGNANFFTSVHAASKNKKWAKNLTIQSVRLIMNFCGVWDQASRRAVSVVHSEIGMLKFSNTFNPRRGIIKSIKVFENVLKGIKFLKGFAKIN